MKKQIYYLSIGVILAFLNGCVTEVDEVFEKSASERLDEHLIECRELLLSAKNGWLIEYYPASNQAVGGFNFIALFDKNGSVTVASEITSSDYLTTSHYSLLTSNSVVLTFDTYNDIFHYLSDPDVGVGESYGGDFEFKYISGNENEMTFKGTRTENTILFKALGEEVDWKDYLDKVLIMNEKISSSPYGFFVWNGASQSIEFELDDVLNIFTYAPDSSQPYAIKSVSFCYTPSGITLYETIQIGDAFVKTFTWDDVNMKYVSEDAKTESGTATTVELEATLSSNYVPFETFLGSWILSYGATGTSTATVSITENVYNKQLKMTGLSTFTVLLNYSKKTGKLSMTAQYVGMYSNTYYTYLCPWDNTAGYLTWSSGTGFDLTYNGDETNPKLAISDNGVWGGQQATGMLYYCFFSQPPSNSNVAGSISASTQYPYLIDFHK